MKTFGNIVIVIGLMLTGMVIGLFIAVALISQFMVVEGASPTPDYQLSPLTATIDTNMQPFGPSQEDEYTATYALQDTEYLQVTANQVFLNAAL